MELLARLKLFWPQQVLHMHYKNRSRRPIGIRTSHACLINSANKDHKNRPCLGEAIARSSTFSTGLAASDLPSG